MKKLLLNEIPQESIKDKVYVNYCFSAMSKICDYMSWVLNFKEDDEDIDDASRIYERNYIITLASLLSQINNNKKMGLIGGEVAKSFEVGSNDKYKEFYANIRKKQNSSYKKTTTIVFPDFLIHEDHCKTNITREKQHFILEAKTNLIKDDTYFHLDFLKLNFYIENLNFDNAAYLIVNNNLSTIQAYLDSYVKEVGHYFNDIFDRLYFFIQEEYKQKPKIYELKEESELEM